MGEREIEVMKEYKNINAKLKKRFFRKPNYKEVCEDFRNLSMRCENDGMPSYAGVCWLATAKVEGTMGNKIGERESLVKAADHFLKEEEDAISLGLNSVELRLADGLHTYELVKSKYRGAAMPIKINLELVAFLKRIKRGEYIQTYLDEAIELSEGRPLTKIFCMELLAQHFIDETDYWAALETYLEISKIAKTMVANGHIIEVLLRTEISIVMCLLIYKPVEQSLTPELLEIMERYTWGDKDDPHIKACHMNEEIFINLQSLVAECQSRDCSGLLRLEGAFWPFITTEQKDLLRILVKHYYPYPF